MSTPLSDFDRHPAPDPFSSNLPCIQQAIRMVVRRRRLSADEGEDFSGHVMLRLLENDRAVLRRFEGRSSLRTFLIVTIDRMLLDYRVSRWGKWRASAEAHRLGAIALLLERLVYRDGLSLSEAGEMLRLHHGVTPGAAELDALFARLPVRRSRQFVSERALDGIAGQGESPDVCLSRPYVARTVKALGRAVERLGAEERSLVSMHFSEGRSIADIARVQRVDQRALYRRLQAVLARLRSDLEQQGIVAEDVCGWLGQADLPASAGLRLKARTDRRPQAPGSSMVPSGAAPAVGEAAASVA